MTARWSEIGLPAAEKTDLCIIELEMYLHGD